ncbi:hypothetical protein Rhopal_003331-T1 [Rhodotorula paludigena]|uniref:Uncharacterized protein n=1 Tax=Rhodotorula paludigena TaxID=86838 RepID=A0AAV5GMQ8_9BASI|nr:hypothetical protein Rhopal_003331-T1 [Rhodotorula paludigena]
MAGSDTAAQSAAAKKAQAAAQAATKAADAAVKAAKAATEAADAAGPQVPALGGSISIGAAGRTFSAPLKRTQRTTDDLEERPTPPPSPLLKASVTKELSAASVKHALISSSTHLPSSFVSPQNGRTWPMCQPIWPVLLDWSASVGKDVNKFVFLSDIFGSGRDADIGSLAMHSLEELDTEINPDSPLKSASLHHPEDHPDFTYGSYSTGEPEETLEGYAIYVYPRAALRDDDDEPIFAPAPFWNSLWSPAVFADGKGKLQPPANTSTSEATGTADDKAGGSQPPMNLEDSAIHDSQDEK